MASSNSFDFADFLVRLALALVLVFATYNPSGYSYYHWLMDSLSQIGPLVVLAGVTLIIGWVMYLRATFRSLGLLGILLTVAFFGTLLWLAVDKGLVSPDNVSAIIYLGLVLLSATLAIGMSWSHIRRKLSGQVDVDDVDEG